MTSVKSQAWSADLMIAFFIFTIALVVYFTFSTDQTVIKNSGIGLLSSDIKLLSDTLLSEGYPMDWDNNTVTKIGLTDGDSKINKHKLHNFSIINYNTSKKLLGTTYDYALYFQNTSNANISIHGFCGKGKYGFQATKQGEICKINYSGIDYEDLIKIDRILVYHNNSESRIVKMVLYLWN